MKTAKRTRPAKAEWSKRPSRSVHPSLGVRLRWQEKARRGRVERFPEYDGPFIAIVDETAISEHRTLTAAKKAAERALRERAIA